jgi:hypothetical protein
MNFANNTEYHQKRELITKFYQDFYYNLTNDFILLKMDPFLKSNLEIIFLPSEEDNRNEYKIKVKLKEVNNFELITDLNTNKKKYLEFSFCDEAYLELLKNEEELINIIQKNIYQYVQLSKKDIQRENELFDLLEKDLQSLSSTKESYSLVNSFQKIVNIKSNKIDLFFKNNPYQAICYLELKINILPFMETYGAILYSKDDLEIFHELVLKIDPTPGWKNTILEVVTETIKSLNPHS